MKTKTHIKAGAITVNHNETLVPFSADACGYRKTVLRTASSAAAATKNNDASQPSKGLKVKTAHRAGVLFC